MVVCIVSQPLQLIALKCGGVESSVAEVEIIDSVSIYAAKSNERAELVKCVAMQ